jgi:hypothetical protein
MTRYSYLLYAHTFPFCPHFLWVDVRNTRCRALQIVFHWCSTGQRARKNFPSSTYFFKDLLDATDHVIEEGSRYARRQRNKGETASLFVEKRRETVSFDSELSINISDDFASYKMLTRRYVLLSGSRMYLRTLSSRFTVHLSPA